MGFGTGSSNKQHQLQSGRSSAARYRYRNGLNKSFLGLLSSIEVWVLQTRLPHIDSERKRDLDEVCAKISETCACFITRFEQLLPWARGGGFQVPLE